MSISTGKEKANDEVYKNAKPKEQERSYKHREYEKIKLVNI
jgi:hypothetical protein